MPFNADLTSLVAGAVGLTVSAALGWRWLRRRDADLRSAMRLQADHAANDSLNQLAAFGRALSSAVESSAARQVFWRFMPTFAGNREVWLLTRRGERWESLVHDRAGDERSEESIEASANRVLAEGHHGKGLVIESEWCLPLVAGETVVGVMGVRRTPELSSFDTSVIQAAVGLLALSVRNCQLHADTRESTVRDGLTGCFTRAYALEALQAELRRSRRTRRPVSVLMIDIDGFSTFNQRHGHPVGDALLAAIGARLATMLRGTDIKCRYGGDEFLIVLPDTMAQGAAHVAANLAEALGHMTLDGTVDSGPQVSLGLAVSGKAESDARALISSAEGALKQAKAQGVPYWTTQLAKVV